MGACRSLFIPLSDRSSWEQLTQRTVQLLRQLLAVCPQDRITLVGESVRNRLVARCSTNMLEHSDKLRVPSHARL